MEKKKATEYKAQLQKTYKRQNNYIKKKFDRVSVTLPKGTKDKIIASGDTLNGFINKAVAAMLESVEGTTSDS
jgi:hypothetical protein